MSAKVALIMAGGTGGHIFPGLAVAQALRARGWRVHWLGQADSMEARLVPPQGFPLETIEFSGVRGKGLKTLALLPWRLAKALWQSLQVLRRVQPDVVLGFGGYITFPVGLASALSGRALVLHEANAVAGTANRVLGLLARRRFNAFPQGLKHAQWVGNPLRTAFLQQPGPAERLRSRSGPLQLLVLGGSLGAAALNEVVPQALALIPAAQRPRVTHQSGTRHLDTLRARYAAAGVQAELVDFIDDTAAAMAAADLVLCRAGASTVSEIAAVGAAAVFVPLPSAIDDHQSANARFLVRQGGGQLLPQRELTPQRLAELLQKTERSTLIQWGLAAKNMAKTEAVSDMVAACEELCA